ncbi:hypothetical protein PYH58_10565 [Mammaliicoccus sciuri]|uniref:hypothetical protein n=1 Tax=Mammaliicoccus sciuri TaxID=1296 RepID=UPI0033650078
MEYKVIRPFNDKHTGHKYGVGDAYPVNGADVPHERFKELYHKANPYGQQYIVIDVDKRETKKDLIEIAEQHEIIFDKPADKLVKAEILEKLGEA